MVLSAAANTRQSSPEGPAPCHRFDDVYEEFFEFLWRSAVRLGVPKGAVDDVVQDTFVVVHRRLEEFEGRSALKTWLYGILRRVVSDFRRRTKSEERRRDEAGAVLLQDAEAKQNAYRGPEADAQRQEAAALLFAFLETLPESQREVFVLSELEQMRAPEIVEATGANLNTVYSRLRLGRRAFERFVARREAV